MFEFEITYNFYGQARLFTVSAESDGEALELFDAFQQQFDDEFEILDVKGGEINE